MHPTRDDYATFFFFADPDGLRSPDLPRRGARREYEMGSGVDLLRACDRIVETDGRFSAPGARLGAGGPGGLGLRDGGALPGALAPGLPSRVSRHTRRGGGGGRHAGGVPRSAATARLVRPRSPVR